MTKTGPKVRLLFFSSCFTNFFCLFRFYLCYKGTGRVGLNGDGKNRPKQCVRCVIWAIGMSSFFFIFLLILTNFFCLFRFYSCYKEMRRVVLDSDGKNGPKRCVRHIIWAIGMFSFFSSCFY